MAEFVHCRWCRSAWQASDRDGFAVHECHCSLMVDCPRCGATPTVRCVYPSGVTLVSAAHSVREKAARAPRSDW